MRPPEFRGPGLGEPPEPLLIRHWILGMSYSVIDGLVTYSDEIIPFGLVFGITLLGFALYLFTS